MNNFLDSNVLINYIFSFDKFHTESQKLVFNSSCYISSNVKNEVDNVFINKNDDYKKFLFKIGEIVNCYSDHDLISDVDIHGFIDNFGKVGNFEIKNMHFAFEELWNKLNLNMVHNAFEVKLKLDWFNKEFIAIHHLRYSDVYKLITIVPNHSKKDKKVLNRIIDENLREFLHKNDERILFDADEFSRNNPNLNLQFVSADVNFIKTIQILIDDLGFDKYVNLCEFTSCS